MPISRRFALAYASAVAACATSPVAAAVRDFQLYTPMQSNPGTSQLLQHQVIHRDEVEGAPYFAALSLAAPDSAWMAIGTLDESDYRAALKSYRLRGYRLRRVNAFQTKNGIRYAAIWQWGPGAPQQVRHDMTLAEFQVATEHFAQQGYTLAHIDSCTTHSGPRFAATWEKSAGPAQKIFANLTGAEYQNQLAVLVSQGFNARQIAGYTQNGEARFAAVFAKDGVSREAHSSIPASEFQSRSAAMVAQGYRLADASGFVVRGRPFYTAVWEKA